MFLQYRKMGDEEIFIPALQTKVDEQVKHAHTSNFPTTIVIRSSDASSKCQVDSDGSWLRVTFLIKFEEPPQDEFP